MYNKVTHVGHASKQIWHWGIAQVRGGVFHCRSQTLKSDEAK